MNNTESSPEASHEREAALFVLAAAKSGTERADFLKCECAGDPELHHRVESLLAAHERPNSTLDAPVNAVLTIKVEPPEALEDDSVGRIIGRYKLLEKVGEGGCGVVYVAEQTEPVFRRVALKVIKLGMDTKSVVARFEAERQALAMMDHPNIAKVLDAGATENGRPYFVMELVRGVKITDYCDQSKLTTDARLDLFIKVCQAVQHAHQKGIIHRDIKPSNILVTLHDGVPVPKVIDFGIAKATDRRLTEKTVYTELHQFIGTPAYMSPEQAEMSGLDIDTRSDIYSLGVLLYELLTGCTPFDAKELLAAGLDSMRRTIREKDPLRPSTRLNTLSGQELTTMAQQRGVDVLRLVHAVRGDLDWIAMKCLEKDRTRRYETANGLAADVKRFLSSEPIMARPPSNLYRFEKFVRRNKLTFTAAAIVVMALVLGVTGTILGLLRAEKQRRAAEAAQHLAEQRFLSARQFVHDVFQEVAPEFASLIGASKAIEVLSRISVTFLESLAKESGADKELQAEQAWLYRVLSQTLGNPYSPNSLGDYNAALGFANRSLEILNSLQKSHPKDPAVLTNLWRTEDCVGVILLRLDRADEALPHHKRGLEVARQMLNLNPNDELAKDSILLANMRIGHCVRAQGHYREALDNYYLPSCKELFNRPLDTNLSSAEMHKIWVAHINCGGCQLELDKPAEALQHLEQALAVSKTLTEREANNARWARDLGQNQSGLGVALLELGRFDEATNFMEQGNHTLEGLVDRDPVNQEFQTQLVQCLHGQANGCAKVARDSAVPLWRRIELWRQTIDLLTRCEERLASPQLERANPKEAREVPRDLQQARGELKKIQTSN